MKNYILETSRGGDVWTETIQNYETAMSRALDEAKAGYEVTAWSAEGEDIPDAGTLEERGTFLFMLRDGFYEAYISAKGQAEYMRDHEEDLEGLTNSERDAVIDAAAAHSLPEIMRSVETLERIAQIVKDSDVAYDCNRAASNVRAHFTGTIEEERK